MAAAVAAGLAVAVPACALGPSASKPITLCGEQRASIVGGAYIVHNNEYGTREPECIQLDHDTGFTVTQSSIAMPADGGPGGYPSVYQGCHWGSCTSGGLSADPVQVGAMTEGGVITSWTTAQPGTGVYSVAYDIWFNRTPVTSGQPDCAELMVWLGSAGGVRPFGAPIATGIVLDGRQYDVWAGQQHWGHTITYLLTNGTTSVTGLDVGTLAHDAVSRGYLSDSCYLISVEAGFEIWQAGTGLASSDFSVSVR